MESTTVNILSSCKYLSVYQNWGENNRQARRQIILATANELRWHNLPNDPKQENGRCGPDPKPKSQRNEENPWREKHQLPKPPATQRLFNKKVKGPKRIYQSHQS